MWLISRIYRKFLIILITLTVGGSIGVVYAEYITFTLPWGGSASANTWTYIDTQGTRISRSYTASNPGLYAICILMETWNAVNYVHRTGTPTGKCSTYAYYVQPDNEHALLGIPAWTTTKHTWNNGSGPSHVAYTSVSTLDTSDSSPLASTEGCWAGSPCLPFTYKVYDDNYQGLPSDFTQIIYSQGWIYTSGWPTRTYNSSVHYSNVPNATYILSSQPGFTQGFYGGSITRLYTMAYNRGSATVTIDGTPYTVNDYALTTRWQAAQTWSLSPGLHTIEVKVGSTGYIDLDAFIIDKTAYGSGTWEDSAISLLTYIGNWTNGTGWPNASHGDVSWSAAPEDAMRFTFTGNQITYYYTKANNRAKAAVTIDGVNKGYVDLYSSTVQWQQSTTFTNLGQGIHNIHISHSGQSSDCSGICYIDIDKLVVQ